MDPEQKQEQEQKKGLIYQLNKTVGTAQRFRGRYKKGLAVKTAIRKQGLKRGAIFLLSNPVGWIILLILFILLLVVLILLVFTSPTSATPPPTVACTDVPGAVCEPQGTACPVVDGKQTYADTSGSYTCSADSSGKAQTCCLSPSGTGYFIPPFACGLKYWGLTYGPFTLADGSIHRAHEPWAVDFNRSPQDLGDPVRAAASGTVSYVDRSQGGVIIQHSGGYSTIYWHMMNVIVNKSQKVVAGQQIGQIDTNGDAFGSHLHFQERLNSIGTEMTFYGSPYVTGALAGYLANPTSIGLNKTKILPEVTGSCP